MEDGQDGRRAARTVDGLGPGAQALPHGVLRVVYAAELVLFLVGSYVSAELLLVPFNLLAFPAFFGFVAAVVAPADLRHRSWSGLYLHACALCAAAILLLDFAWDHPRPVLDL